LPWHMLNTATENRKDRVQGVKGSGV